MTKEKWIKVAKGAGLAGGGAVLAYLIEAIPGMELGEWGPVAAAMLSVILNLIRKYRD